MGALSIPRERVVALFTNHHPSRLRTRMELQIPTPLAKDVKPQSFSKSSSRAIKWELLVYREKGSECREGRLERHTENHRIHNFPPRPSDHGHMVSTLNQRLPKRNEFISRRPHFLDLTLLHCRHMAVVLNRSRVKNLEVSSTSNVHLSLESRLQELGCLLYKK